MNNSIISDVLITLSVCGTLMYFDAVHLISLMLWIVVLKVIVKLCFGGHGSHHSESSLNKSLN